MDFPLQNTLHIPFVLETREFHRLLYVAALYSIQIPLALHMLPTLLAAIYSIKSPFLHFFPVVQLA